MTNFNTRLDRALSEMAQLSRYETRGLSGGAEWKVRINMMYPPIDTTYTVPAGEAENDKEAWQWVIQHHLKKDFGEEFWRKMASKDAEDVKNFVTFSGTSPSFNKHDLKALQHPKTQQAIEAFLNKNPAGYKWNFILIDENLTIPQIMKHAEANNMEINQAMAQVYDIETKGHITFVKKGSSGDALDANMLTHTIAHAILSNTPKNQAIMDHCRKELIAFAQSVVGDHSRNRDKELYLVSNFLHMSAAKSQLRAYAKDVTPGRQQKLLDRSLVNMDEAVHEMFAVFVRRDFVKFRPNEFCQYTDDQTLVDWAQRIEDDFNTKFRIALDGVVGTFVVD